MISILSIPAVVWLLRGSLIGLAGIQPNPDGSLRLRPQPVAGGNVMLSAYGYRGHRVDIAIRSDGFEVSVDGRHVPPRSDGTVVAVRPADSGCGSGGGAG